MPWAGPTNNKSAQEHWLHIFPSHKSTTKEMLASRSYMSHIKVLLDAHCTHSILVGNVLTDWTLIVQDFHL